ncbi:MAG: hypothetical protein H6522_09330 [Mycolicibacterium sp.]|nr:hypothetical protein [Mycolicibacterium sp.]
MIALAVLSILTVVVVVAINPAGANREPSRCLTSAGCVSADATAALAEQRLHSPHSRRPDSTVAPGSRHQY